VRSINEILTPIKIVLDKSSDESLQSAFQELCDHIHYLEENQGVYSVFNATLIDGNVFGLCLRNVANAEKLITLRRELIYPPLMNDFMHRVHVGNKIVASGVFFPLPPQHQLLGSFILTNFEK